MNKLIGAAALAAGLLLASGVTAAQKEPDCGRACLKAVMDTYIAAMVAHDPSHAPLAADVKFVENATPLSPGDGFWKTASAPGSSFRIYVPDPTAQQVAYIGVMQEMTKDGNKPVQVGIRLKLKGGKIVEAEQLLARGLRDTSLKNLVTPRAAFVTPVPPEQRDTRDHMLAIGRTYYDALVKGEGKLAPFADDCLRRENGMQTTGNTPAPGAPPGMAAMGAMGCSAQLDTKSTSYIDSIDNRRVEIADTETGLVFGLSHFRHSMKQKFVKIVGVPGVDKIDLAFNAFDLPAAHIYKISGGKIHEIEAMGFSAPYQSKTGWE